VSRKLLFVAYGFVFCGVIWGAQQTNPAAQPAVSPQTTNVTAQARARITGTVNSASSGQPVRKALITLMPANQGGNRGQQGFGGALNPPGQPGAQAPQQGRTTRSLDRRSAADKTHSSRKTIRTAVAAVVVRAVSRQPTTAPSPSRMSLPAVTAFASTVTAF